MIIHVDVEKVVAEMRRMGICLSNKNGWTNTIADVLEDLYGLDTEIYQELLSKEKV